MLNTPEYIILIDLLKGKLPDNMGVADQDKLLMLFRRHRLLSSISTEAIDILEPAFQKRWREAIRSFTIRSMQLTGVLEEVFRELNRKELDVVSVKGPVLSQRLYGDIGRRHYGDLDLLVRREEFQKVLDILEGMDYRMTHPKKGLSPKQLDYYFRYKKDVALVNRMNGVVVELHVGIFRHELIRTDSDTLIWNDLSEEKIGNTPVRCMNKNTTFLYLLYHGGQHLYFRLFWLKDVADAMDKWELDHRWILDQAISMGIDRLVGMGLLLSKEFFGTEIPSEYRDYLRRNRTVLMKLKRIALSRISGPERETRAWKVRRYRFVLLLQPGFRYLGKILGNVFHRKYIRRRLGGF